MSEGDGPRLEIGGGRDRRDEGRVPAPRPPGDPEAWYAPAVRAQYEVHPGVVVTIRETAEAFAYEVREPPLGPADEAALARIRGHFSTESRRRPLTREGTDERARAGFEPKYRRAIDRLLDAGPSARRRIDYHALRDLRLLGPGTPLSTTGSRWSTWAGATTTA